ncbi:MAG: acyltransferase family protein [Pseudonocardiaceae bacterium]
MSTSGAVSSGGNVTSTFRDTAIPSRNEGSRRERWLDLLRAIALGRVIIYHLFGAAWLSLVFPSIGVMFALAGSLTMRSLYRTPAVKVVGRRLRRLLPPLWLMGAILVPIMLWQGWARETGDGALQPEQLIFWLFPVFDPPGSTWAADATVVLWYIRTYLWFLLLTPLLLWAFRRRPVLTLLAPLTVVALNEMFDAPLADWGLLGPALLDVATFGTCWILGFAHRDGILQRMRPATVSSLALGAIGAGALWTVINGADAGYDLNELPLGQALVSIGAVLLLLRISPSLTMLDRLPWLGRLVTLVNARAITIYLWHNIAIDLAVPVDDWLGWESMYAQLGVSVALTAVAVLAFGWIEDLAGRRPVQFVPTGPPRRPSAHRGRHARPVGHSDQAGHQHHSQRHQTG